MLNRQATNRDYSNAIGNKLKAYWGTVRLINDKMAKISQKCFHFLGIWVYIRGGKE